jgi:hypothetical protein
MIESQEFSIPILLENEINPIFIRATSFLLNEFSNEFISLNDTDLRKNKLKDLWKSEYSATLVECPVIKNWSDIQFKNFQDKIVFLLKHGSF